LTNEDSAGRREAFKLTVTTCPIRSATTFGSTSSSGISDECVRRITWKSTHPSLIFSLANS